MTEPEQCIICLDSLPLPRATTSTLGAAEGGDTEFQLLRDGGAAATDTDTTATTDTTTTTTTTDTTEITGTTASPPPLQSPTVTATVTAANTATIKAEYDELNNPLNVVAALDGCEHIIHEACIRSWAQKTNSCPICRNVFHSVRVFNGVDGTAISKYNVEDKKQVAEFDFQQWLGENVEEEPEQSHPCPICDSAEREDVLLLCDSCDAAYHTHCIGLDDIPDGDWYCMECRHLFQLTDHPESSRAESRPGRPRNISRPSPRDVRGYHVRTRARLRRARRQARNVEWQGAWGQFAGRFYDLSDVDLDNLDEEDEELEQFRRFQQLDRRELQRWQQRVNIAHRLGAQDAFVSNIPPQINEHLQPPPPPPVQETREERQAWGALELAREAEETTPTNRKRKARSATASPAEPIQEPERKLKRPRTRRLATQQGEASGSASSPATTASGTTVPVMAGTNGSAIPREQERRRHENEPALVSSLLKELEPLAPFEDEAGQAMANGTRIPPGASSPVISPSPSNHSSPRALSMTPPPIPHTNGRPGSPNLSLSTHIEPRYPPANYSPSRNGQGSGSGSGSDQSDSEGRSVPSSRTSRSRRRPARALELRQPQPRRAHPIASRVEDHSPTRASMTQEEKKNINDIVKTALRPHWRAQKLTPDQYAAINRDISRKLYEEVKDAASLDDDTRRSWENRVTQEVAQAVAGLSVA